MYFKSSELDLTISTYDNKARHSVAFAKATLV
jgi:hypothetical protein